MFSLNLSDIALLTSVSLLFVVQIYYVWLFAHVPRAAHKELPESQKGVSVVIMVHESYDFVAHILPSMLSQEHPRFEIVLVDIGSGEEFLYSIKALEIGNEHLKVTSLKRDSRFRVTTKMAYNVGIKAATYDNIILSTTTTIPASPKWLSCMASGFEVGSVVLGYCSVQRLKGLSNKFIRTSRAMMSLRYFASAIDGRPYRGVINNVGFTKQEYFDTKGFNHLNMNIGEEDLFIQKIATAQNTTVVITPDATTVQQLDGIGVPAWSAQRRTSCYSYNLYPRAIKHYLSTEIFSRVLFFVVAVMGVVMLPMYYKIAVGALVIVRFTLLSIVLHKFSIAVGDRGVTKTLVIDDIFSPLSEMRLYMLRKVISPRGLWR